MSQPASSERLRLVAELAAALRADADARSDQDDARILGLVQRLEAELRPTIHRALPKPPPRRVAVAMVLAIHSQPHLASTYASPERAGTLAVDEPPPWTVDLPLVVPNELLERALGISQWEIDDLREEVDLRAGRDLKQARALQWMWTHFGLDRGASAWALLRVLVPDLADRAGDVGLLRRGAQLHPIVGGAELPPHALFLPWAAPTATLPPLTTFRSRYVDKGLRRALTRGIGADDGELDAILEHMIAVLPRGGLARALQVDQWRSHGFASLTGLGAPYAAAAYLTDPVRDAEIDWERWLTVAGDRLLVLDDARILFDTLATARVQTAIRSVYAAMLAGLGPSRSAGASLATTDLPLLNVFGHLERVLRPLVAWPRRPDAHHTVAAALGLPLETVAERLILLGDEWEAQLRETWLAVPTSARPYTVGSLLLQHLVALWSSLRRLAWDAPDPRADHRAPMLLFAAHYLAEARLERLWLRGLSDSVLDEDAPVPPPEDIVGTWFPGCWGRVLDVLASDTTTLSNLAV